MMDQGLAHNHEKRSGSQTPDQTRLQPRHDGAAKHLPRAVPERPFSKENGKGFSGRPGAGFTGALTQRPAAPHPSATPGFQSPSGRGAGRGKAGRRNG